MISSEEMAEEDGDPLPEMRTPRRSNSAHYGCSRHALRYLLRKLGLREQERHVACHLSHVCARAGGGRTSSFALLPAPDFRNPLLAQECRRISLMLRMQMLQMARRDLNFVRGVSAAERTVLHIACRQLAYKARPSPAAARLRSHPHAERPDVAGSLTLPLIPPVAVLPLSPVNSGPYRSRPAVRVRLRRPPRSARPLPRSPSRRLRAGRAPRLPARSPTSRPTISRRPRLPTCALASRTSRRSSLTCPASRRIRWRRRRSFFARRRPTLGGRPSRCCSAPMRARAC